jgi:hypothetical protein
MPVVEKRGRKREKEWEFVRFTCASVNPRIDWMPN